MSQLQPTIEEYLNDYNAESKQPMPLVMFMDAISHVARITRVLRQPKGNMLLLGVGGSGRQSLSRLSTFMAECRIFSIEITKGYGLSEWRESLKEILLYAGIKAQPAVFLFSDTQIVFEAMLEDINNVLNTVESVLKLKLNLNHVEHTGRRPEPLRARGRRDHHHSL